MNLILLSQTREHGQTDGAAGITLRFRELTFFKSELVKRAAGEPENNEAERQYRRHAALQTPRGAAQLMS